MTDPEGMDAARRQDRETLLVSEGKSVCVHCDEPISFRQAPDGGYWADEGGRPWCKPVKGQQGPRQHAAEG